MELRKRVARAIAQRNYPNGTPRDLDDMAEGFLEDADAAIAALLDALKSTFTPVDEQDAELVWSNMLAAFRTEALGEG